MVHCRRPPPPTPKKGNEKKRKDQQLWSEGVIYGGVTRNQEEKWLQKKHFPCSLTPRRDCNLSSSTAPFTRQIIIVHTVHHASTENGRHRFESLSLLQFKAQKICDTTDRFLKKWLLQPTGLSKSDFYNRQDYQKVTFTTAIIIKKINL